MLGWKPYYMSSHHLQLQQLPSLHLFLFLSLLRVDAPPWSPTAACPRAEASRAFPGQMFSAGIVVASWLQTPHWSVCSEVPIIQYVYMYIYICIYVCICSMLGVCWAHVGSMLGRVGPSLGHVVPMFGPILALWRGILGLCWAMLAPCWAMLGPCWAYVGHTLGLYWAYVGPMLGPSLAT